MNRRDLFRLAGKVGLVALAQQVPWTILELAGFGRDDIAEAALPQGYQLFPGSVLFSGNAGIAGLTTNTKGFGPGTTTGTDNSNPIYIKTQGNTKSLKVTIDATAGQTAHYLEWTINQSFERVGGTFGFWVCAPDDTNTLPDFVLRISSAPFSKYFAMPVRRYTRQHDGQTWNFISFHRDAMTNTGGESWTNTMTRVRLQVLMPAGKVGDVYIDSGLYGFYDRPKVVFIFNGGYASAKSEGYDYMAPRGLRGAVAVNSSLVGSLGRLTVADNSTLYNADWDLLSHAAVHTDQTTLTQDQRVQDMRTNQAYLLSNGWVRGKTQYVYPNGSYNAAVIADLRAAGYDSGWSMNAMIQRSSQLWPERMGLGRYPTDVTSSLSTLKGYVNLAISMGGTICFYAHDILVGATGTQTERSTFRGLIDYIAPLVAGGVMDNPTPSEWIDGLTQPRRLRGGA